MERRRRFRCRTKTRPSQLSPSKTSGCGIASEDLARVFEPFFTTKPNGNGLGLSICRSILWEVGGTLNVQSELARGTRVVVTVPWAPLVRGHLATS